MLVKELRNVMFLLLKVLIASLLFSEPTDISMARDGLPASIDDLCLKRSKKPNRHSPP